MKTANPSVNSRMSGVRLAVSSDRERHFGKYCDCEEPRPATLYFREAAVEPFGLNNHYDAPIHHHDH
jgi:hypothetical protein